MLTRDRTASFLANRQFAARRSVKDDFEPVRGERRTGANHQVAEESGCGGDELGRVNWASPLISCLVSHNPA